MKTIAKEIGSAVTAEAVARVGAYLHCLGIPTDRAEAEAAAVVEQCASQSGAASAELADQALAHVMSGYDAWLKNFYGSGCEPAGSWPGLIAWHARSLLAETPEAFLRREDSGDGQPLGSDHFAIRASVQPAAPEPTPTPMPAHSFGPAPQILQPSFWRGLMAGLVSVKNRIVRRIQGG